MKLGESSQRRFSSGRIVRRLTAYGSGSEAHQCISNDIEGFQTAELSGCVCTPAENQSQLDFVGLLPTYVLVSDFLIPRCEVAMAFGERARRPMRNCIPEILDFV